MPSKNTITIPAMKAADFAGFLNVLAALSAAGWLLDSADSRAALRMALRAGLVSP